METSWGWNSRQFNTELEIIFISNLRKTNYTPLCWGLGGVSHPFSPFLLPPVSLFITGELIYFLEWCCQTVILKPTCITRRSGVGVWEWSGGDGSCGITVVFETFWSSFWTASPYAAYWSVYSALLSSHWWPIALPDLQPLLVFVADVTRVLLLCWYSASASQVTGTNQ